MGGEEKTADTREKPLTRRQGLPQRMVAVSLCERGFVLLSSSCKTGEDAGLLAQHHELPGQVHLLA